ncbi:glutathione S-transferase family protein [Nitratireductor basaltis]|uniref:Glutathione S-transferase n=1 Tax=Nitratireductor basaltis TaxID=472175 RepID=A0A084U578_9HYPH|nr:glutathione S-transferase family protein [Nitratireductor basaltis]KFB08114.1 Glutathione S-transferase [Nitratireductor basaltis]
MQKSTVYHIPVCPFSQRLEILLELKGQREAVSFEVVDITRPRDPALLEKTRGTTALPVLETPDGKIIKESLVILDYLDEALPGPLIRRSDPLQHAIERMLIVKEGAFTAAGYSLVMNQKEKARDQMTDKLVALYAELDDFLRFHNPHGIFLFDDFGLAEAVFTPVFMRFWFLEYYEGFELPRRAEFDRVHVWREACLAHEAAQQVSREEVVKLYYDYALGAGNGALPEGRKRSSFAFEPHWRERPWPPREKYGPTASDKALGLV